MTQRTISNDLAEAGRKGSLLHFWIPILVVHVAIATCATTLTAKGIFFPELLAEFGYSHTRGSALLSINVVVDALLSLFIAFVVLRHVGLRALSLFSVSAVAAGCLYASFATSYGDLVIAYMLMAGGSISTIVAPLIATGWYPQRRALVLGLLVSGSTTGGVFLTQAIRVVVEAWGWRAGYQAIGATLILVVVPALIFGLRYGGPDKVASDDVSRKSPLSRETFQLLTHALKRSEFWLILVAYAVFSINTSTYFLHFISAMKSKGYSLGDAVNIMSGLVLCAAIAKLLFGHLGDRLGARPTLTASFLLSALGIFLMQYAAQREAVYLFTIAYGLSYSAPLVLLPVLIADSFGTERLAMFNATIGAVAHLIAASGPIFAGWTFDRTGSYDTTFQTFAVLLIIAAVATRLTGWRSKSPRPKMFAVAGEGI